MSKKAIETN